MKFVRKINNKPYRPDKRDKEIATSYAEGTCSQFPEEKIQGKSDMLLYARYDFLQGVKYAMDKMNKID